MKYIFVATACMTFAALVFAQQPPASGSGKGNADKGKALYTQVGCYACHGLAGQGAQMTGPRLSRTQLPFDGFLWLIRHPAKQMPPYEAPVLSDQDAADIYAYLQQMPAPRDPKTIPLLNAGS